MPKRSSAFPAQLLDELDEALMRGKEAHRAALLRGVTDLFFAGNSDHSDDTLALFDDVLTTLAQNIEVSARALLASRLASHPAAPPRIVHALAFDDLIEIAAPVLSQSTRLDDNALIENARTKSQAHLLAISTRLRLSGLVTDVLVERGDTRVVMSAASNPGAEFSEAGYARLVERAEGNDDLATCVGSRTSIPRHHLLKLIARASAAVREKLRAVHPDAREAIDAAVRRVVANAQIRSAADDIDVMAAQLHVGRLHEASRLDEAQVAQFARESRFNETNAAIACLTSLPFVTVESMMAGSRSEGVMVLAKVLDFSWSTLKAIFDMRVGLQGPQSTDESFTKVSYERLKPSTAQQILRFHRMQQVREVS
ncbi:DUF2336 domain-containing protein [Bradyrhizobium sp. LHD-71]|uniref:DUF2336 domain-containing protein n=1 Tax=Bradyrhizobium sp. LHD-71 TaxID=3072141 RepID=UPI00280DA523|nr:DUF2336 domain-containing protein [Bradyrhizobium sp. LHD-71]MDQ8732577.1 DUF2336 domain-containing protein [Bradyrhizobium sp. LHD-71]